MVEGYSFHGHAIVSADDRIADAAGATPKELRNEADWKRFQAALDSAVVTILGRAGHRANPNVMRRNRIVLSSAASRVERFAEAWWWNPAEATIEEALAVAAPGGGIVAVPGGRRVFDLFLDIGFDEFHLARAGRVEIPGGVPIFTAVGSGKTAESLLSASGLRSSAPEILDPAAGISLSVWRRD